MNIRKIAELAGVSVSTVSKIMNNKDENISAATRERVLKVVKEYHYQPYSSAIAKDSKRWILGVLLRSPASMDLTLSGILEQAQADGYTLMIRESAGDPDLEHRNLSVLIGEHPDGLLWEPVSDQSFKLHEPLLESTPSLVYNLNTPGASNIDFGNLAYQATKQLIDLGHRDIGCLLCDGARLPAFLAGYRQCLFDNQILFRDDLVFNGLTDSMIQKISTHTVSGIVCSHPLQAAALYDAVSALHYDLPYDLSLITLKEDSRSQEPFPQISGYIVPHYDYGKYLCSRLIASIEKSPNTSDEFSCSLSLSNTNSISIPYNCNTKKIAVVGSINIDNYLTVEKLPYSGKTVSSSISSIHVGGKAINQAVGISKLGHRGCVIGCVGNDIDSDGVFTTLNQYHIDPIGVKRCTGERTGQAYIFVQQDGNSMISIMSGANNAVTPQFLTSAERLFENTGYCLIQTEIPMPAIIQAAILAQKHKVHTILKPAACGVLPEELLQNIDILVPNYNELNEICPGEQDLEVKAASLISQGVKAVIVTLGDQGAYLRTSNHSEYIPSVPFDPVDTSGACDAFISCLASYLLYGASLSAAARIASYAAGFSITREGVVPALVDKNSLESYIRQREPQLLSYT